MDTEELFSSLSSFYMTDAETSDSHTLCDRDEVTEIDIGCLNKFVTDLNNFVDFYDQYIRVLFITTDRRTRFFK